MTRQRFYGSDTEFCAWMRQCKELPSIGRDFGLSASDNDITLHRYLTSVDAIGSREVQGIMQLEIKTRQGKPSFSQMDTLSKLNMFCGERNTKEGHVRFFGVFILVLSNTTPDDSEKMWWGEIPKSFVVTDATKLRWRLIDRTTLIQLLRFDRHPRSFETQVFRRHHKTSQTMELVTTPLGLQVEVPVVTRS
jgi:hypothetical protein